MPVPLSFGLDEPEETKGVPLSFGLDKPKETTGVPLSYGLDIKKEPEQQPKRPFSADHPNLYGLYGMVKETPRDVLETIVPYMKYINPAERKKFMELSKQEQVRDLLVQDLETILFIVPATKGFKYGQEKIGSIVKKHLPKTYNFFTKNIGKAAPEVAAKTAIPTPKETPKYAGSVNLDKQRISDAAKQVELEMFEKHGIKTVQTQQETIQKAHKVLERFEKDPVYLEERLTKIKAGEIPTIEEEVAHRILNAREFENFVDINIKVQNGELPTSALAEAQRVLESKYFEGKTAADILASDAGRRLNAHNIEVSKNRAFEAVGKLGKDLNKRQMKELAEVDWNNPESVKLFTGRLPDPKLMEYVYEYWYNSILSGIPTHVVNVASNTLWQAFQVPHRLLSAGVDATMSTIKGAARTRFFNEMVPMFAGYKKGFTRGAMEAWKVAKTGKVQETESKWALEFGSYIGAFDRSPNAVVRGIGKALTVPTKALRAMDVWANAMAYDSNLSVMARRASNMKGLKGDARRLFEKDFVQNPTSQAHTESLAFAKYSTFMDDPGQISQWFLNIRNWEPAMFEGTKMEGTQPLRFVIPFVNTIGNLMKRGIEMTPGLGLGLAKGQNASEVIAKQIEGAMLGLYTIYKFDAGEITGPAPQNESEREAFYRQGKKAWAIRVGDKWIQYRRIEPFNTVIASAAIGYDAIKNAKDEETATEIFGKMATGIKDNLLDSSYMQGVTDLLNRHQALRGAEKRLGTSLLIPYSGFMGSITRSLEAAETGSAKLRDTKSWMGAFSRVIPGLYEFVDSKIDVWGKEVELEGGVFRQWLPYKWSQEKPDLTEESLQVLGRYPGHPSQTATVKGKKLKLDDDIYRDFLISYGHAAKEELDKFFNRKLIQDRINNEKYQDDIRNDVNSILRDKNDYYKDMAIKKQIKRLGEQQ